MTHAAALQRTSWLRLGVASRQAVSQEALLGQRPGRARCRPRLRVRLRNGVRMPVLQPRASEDCRPPAPRAPAPLGCLQGVRLEGVGHFLPALTGDAPAFRPPRVFLFSSESCKTLRIVFRPKYIRLTHTHRRTHTQTHTSAYTRARRCSSSRHCAPRGPRGGVTAPQRGMPSDGRRCPGQPQSARRAGESPCGQRASPGASVRGPGGALRRRLCCGRVRRRPGLVPRRPASGAGLSVSCPRSPVPLFLALRVTRCIFSYP